ncbi:MAG TPA: hypothetical protein VGB66_00570 [Longimicrobium sp.]
MRAALSARCREWRWPPTLASREVGVEPPRIAGRPERFRMWIWPGARGTVPVLDCRTIANPGGGCTVRVRMRRSRQSQLSGIVFAAFLAGLPWAAGWGSAGSTALGLLAGAAISLYAVFGSFQKTTERRMRSLVEVLQDAANPAATSPARRAS